MEGQQSRYIPPRIRDCGEELRVHNNTELILSRLKTMYPKLSSYQSAVNKLRAYLIATEEHHPSYEREIKHIEDELVNVYTQSLGKDGTLKGDEVALACIKFIYDFKSVPLRRQLNILHKLKRGQMGLPSKPFENQIRKLVILPDYVSKVVLSNEEQMEAKQKTEASQQQRSRNVILIDFPNTLIRNCLTILRKEDEPLENICVALALLTGRRTIEILLTGSLDQYPGNLNFAYFTGQVKTGLQQIQSVTEDMPTSYIIPLLGSARLISKKLKQVQDIVQHKLGTIVTRESINQRFSHKLSKAVKALIHPGIRFHDLRTLYALITFEAFKPHTFGLNGWVSKVLGHTGINMSTHYTRMQIGPVSHVADLLDEFTS